MLEVALGERAEVVATVWSPVIATLNPPVAPPLALTTATTGLAPASLETGAGRASRARRPRRAPGRRGSSGRRDLAGRLTLATRPATKARKAGAETVCAADCTTITSVTARALAAPESPRREVRRLRRLRRAVHVGARREPVQRGRHQRERDEDRRSPRGQRPPRLCGARLREPFCDPGRSSSILDGPEHTVRWWPCQTPNSPRSRISCSASWLRRDDVVRAEAEVASSVGFMWSFPHSALYAEPARLVQLGLLTEEKEEHGRRRRLYALTGEGRSGSTLAARAAVRAPAAPRPRPAEAVLLRPDERERRPRPRRGADRRPPGAARDLRGDRGGDSADPDDPFPFATLRMGLMCERTFIAFWEEIAANPPRALMRAPSTPAPAPR